MINILINLCNIDESYIVLKYPIYFFWFYSKNVTKNICNTVKNGANKNNIIIINIKYFKTDEILRIYIIAYDTPIYEIFWKNYYILVSVDDKLYLFPTCNVKSIIITMFGMMINIYV